MNLLRPVRIDLSKVDRPRVVQPELLYHFPIPPDLHGLNPRLLLGRRWWNKTRKKAYKSNGGFCQACGGSGRLDAHEQYEFDFGKKIARFQNVVPLCRNCHMYIHWLSCPVHQKKLILQIGNRVLLSAELPVPEEKMIASGDTYDRIQVTLEHTLGYSQYRAFWASGWKLDLKVLRLNRLKYRKHKDRGRLIL